MYCKIQPNSSHVTGLVSYLSKEDEITKVQQERLTASERASEGVVDYLEKENTSLKDQMNKINGLVLNEADKNLCVDFLKNEDRIQNAKFFNGASNQINPEEVAKGIGSNVKGLKTNETHFYMMTIAPSKVELECIEKIADQMKVQMPQATKGELVRSLMEEYTKDAMNAYAKNFNREGINGEKDLVWYGKIEQDRYWKRDSVEVHTNKAIAKEIKQLQKVGGREEEVKVLMGSYARDNGRVIYANMPKSGANYHAHIIISRKDKTQTKSLSPLSKYKESPNHQVNGVGCKAGFNRTEYLKEIERKFDEKLKFDRPFRQSVECLFSSAKLKKMEVNTPGYAELRKEIIEKNEAYNLQRGRVEPFMKSAEGWIGKMELEKLESKISSESGKGIDAYNAKQKEFFQANDQYNEKHGIKERFIHTAQYKVHNDELKKFIEKGGDPEGIESGIYYKHMVSRLAAANEQHNIKHKIKEPYGQTVAGKEMFRQVKYAKENLSQGEYRDTVMRLVEAKKAHNKQFKIREINVRRAMRQVMYKAKSVGRTAIRNTAMMGVNYGVSAVLPSYALKVLNLASAYNKQQSNLMIGRKTVNVVNKKTGQIVGKMAAQSLVGAALPGVGTAVKVLGALKNVLSPASSKEHER